MIKIEKNVDKFISLFKTVGNLTEETDVSFDKEGISLRAVHPSSISFISLTMKKSFFDVYDVEGEKTYTINIHKFIKIISIVGKKKMALEIAEKGITISSGKKSFTLNYFVGKKDARPRPEVQSISKWKINSSDFFSTLDDIVVFSDVCKLQANDNLVIFTKSNMVEGNILVGAEKIESEDCYAYYDVTFLEMIKDIKQIFPQIRIGFSNGTPFIMKGTNDDIDFEFMLAGRVEEND